MTGDRFPGPLLPGPVVDDPSLSHAEWDDLCRRCGVLLSGVAREQTDRQLWWCTWVKLGRDTVPRASEIKRRLRDFVRGADRTLRAIGYLDAADLRSAVDRPPLSTRLRDGHGGATWLALVISATSDAWKDGYWTKRALAGIPEADDVLSGLHALAYTAAIAIREWPDDRGGRAAGGDRHFIWRLLQILEAEGIDVSYAQDRLAPAGADIQGVGWDVLREIWALRPDAFAAGEHSTLTTYYRAAYRRLRNEPGRESAGSSL